MTVVTNIANGMRQTCRLGIEGTDVPDTTIEVGNVWLYSETGEVPPLEF